MIIFLLLGAYLVGSFIFVKVFNVSQHKKVVSMLFHLLEGMKGLSIVFLINGLGYSSLYELLAITAVTMGQTFPIFFKAKGEKGIAPFLGGILAFNPALFLLFIGVFLIIYPITKSYLKAGFIAFLAVPFGLFFRYDGISFVIVFLTVVLILYRHKENFKGTFKPIPVEK